MPSQSLQHGPRSSNVGGCAALLYRGRRQKESQMRDAETQKRKLRITDDEILGKRAARGRIAVAPFWRRGMGRVNKDTPRVVFSWTTAGIVVSASNSRAKNRLIPESEFKVDVVSLPRN